MPLDSIDEPQNIERYTLLFSALPTGSRCVKLLQPNAQWQTTDYFLWIIEFHLRNLQWNMLDKKGRAGQQPPKPLPTPEQRAANFQRKENAEKNKEEIQRVLGMKGG